MPSVCSKPPALHARVTGAYLQPLIEAAAARGVDAGRLARGAGLEAVALDPLPDFLPAQDYIALLDAGAHLAGDAHFGLHVGERVRPGTYSVYGMVLLSCRSFGEAFELTQRYEQLAHDLGRSQLALDGDAALYSWTGAWPRASRHLAESVFAGIRTFGSWLAGRPLAPRALCFVHHSDADPAEYERVLGARPRFGAAANVAVLDAALLALPVPNADPGLYPLLRQHAERLLLERGRAGGVVGQAHGAILQRLAPNAGRSPVPDPVRLAGIAADLDLTPRTLQRKLAGAGSSFQQVLDGARHALAQEYLRHAELPLADIAFLLGFQEQSAFTHAFREWSGMNPGAWRERQRSLTGNSPY
jgi:AraC-like DNA-binding protein